MVSKAFMRWPPLGLLFLTGCGPGLDFNKSSMTAQQMSDRASLVFVGTVEWQTYVSFPFLRVPGEDSQYWRVVDRKVRMEAIARGEEKNRVIDVYEYVWVGGRSGDWNLTDINRRYLFLVRLENGRYHVVRDWWRSIFPIGSGRHDRFPLDASRRVWERAALLQFWVGPGFSPGFPTGSHLDPANNLGAWREVKLLRGLLRHPDPNVRIAACEHLLLLGRAQDECFEQLPPESRTRFGKYYNRAVPADEWSRNRRWEKEFALQDWEELRKSRDPLALEDMKLFTTVNNRVLRQEFCRLFQRIMPNDHDNGCPADQPPPATMVTADGDVPLLGKWPTS